MKFRGVTAQIFSHDKIDEEKTTKRRRRKEDIDTKQNKENIEDTRRTHIVTSAIHWKPSSTVVIISNNRIHSQRTVIGTSENI